MRRSKMTTRHSKRLRDIGSHIRKNTARKCDDVSCACA